MEKTASVVDDISKALYESIKNLEAKGTDCGASEGEEPAEEPADDVPGEN
jgi:hypothetical protein